MTVKAAVSAALRQMQAARLPPQSYFGANEATIFLETGVAARRVIAKRSHATATENGF